VFLYELVRLWGLDGVRVDVRRPRWGSGSGGVGMRRSASNGGSLGMGVAGSSASGSGSGVGGVSGVSGNVEGVCGCRAGGVDDGKAFVSVRTSRRALKDGGF
jgi:hypothetical protein